MDWRIELAICAGIAAGVWFFGWLAFRLDETLSSEKSTVSGCVALILLLVLFGAVMASMTHTGGPR